MISFLTSSCNMKWPTTQKIKDWKNSGKMRRTDDIFWAGDRKVYDLWLSMVIDRLEKEDAKKETTES